MFAAVYHFGPRWDWEGTKASERAFESEDDALRMVAFLRREPRIPLTAIAGMTPEGLAKSVTPQELSFERGCLDARNRLRARLGITRSRGPSDLLERRMKKCFYDDDERYEYETEVRKWAH